MKGQGVKTQSLQTGHGPNTPLTRSKWIAFPLLHCVSLRNVVEFWQPPKLLPYSVVIEEGPHGIVNVPNKALWKRNGHQVSRLRHESTGKTSQSINLKQALEAKRAIINPEVDYRLCAILSHRANVSGTYLQDKKMQHLFIPR